MTDSGTIQSGVIVEPKLFPFKLFYTTYLCVDGGEPKVIPPKTTFIPMSPGRHTLRCYVSYPYQSHLGDSSVEVDIPHDGVVKFRWKSPKLVFLSGKWEEIATP